MATKTKKRKKPAAHRSGVTHSKTKTKSRRKSKRSKTGLSEMISHQGLKKAGKSYAGGLLGGGISGAIDTMLPEDTNPLLRFGAHAIGALAFGAAFDMPNVSAGMAGAYAHSKVTEWGQKLLSEMEDEDYADDDALSEYPDALDENGTPMFLADDGEFYYMEEFELADQYELSESFQADDMYPRYVNSSRF